MSSLPVLKSKYRPIQYIKVNERLLLPSKLKRGDNIIITRNEDKVDENSLILLGKVLEHTSSPDYFASNVWLDASYPYVMLIPGRRGTGKSYTLGVLAEGLSLSKEKSNITTKKTRHTVVIIDTLGQFWQMKYAPKGRDEEERRQLKLLNVWGLKPHGMEHIQVYVPYGKKVNPEWREFQIKFSEIELEELAGALNLDVYQDRMGQLLNHVFNKVREGYTKAKIDEDTGKLRVLDKMPPSTEYGIQDFIDCIDTDVGVISPQTGFHLQTRRALRSRLVDMKRWKIFSETGTKISEIYKKDYLTVVNLEGVGEDFRNLVVGVLVRKIFQARETTRRREKIREIGGTSSSASEDVPSGWLMIDEAHEYCPNTGTTASKKILIKFAKEGRSLGLGLIMATQQPSALSQKISSQSELVISHALAFMADIRALVDRLVNRKVQEYHRRSETFSFEEQIRLLKPGTAILSTMGISRIFLVVIRPRLTIHGGKVPKME